MKAMNRDLLKRCAVIMLAFLATVLFFVQKPEAASSVPSIRVYICSSSTVKVSWTKQKGAAGYIIKISSNSSQTDARKYTRNASASYIRIRRLSEGNTYYVTVTPYKLVNGKKVRLKTRSISFVLHPGSSSKTNISTQKNFVTLMSCDGKILYSRIIWRKGIKFPAVAAYGGDTIIGWSRRKNQSKRPDFQLEVSKIPSPGTYYAVLVKHNTSGAKASDANVSEKYSYVYVVGDSRILRMRNFFGGNPQNSSLIGKSGAKYKNLVKKGGLYDQLIQELDSRMTTSKGKHPAIILSMGLNDLYDISYYISFCREKSSYLKKKYNADFFVTTVGPVNRAQQELIKNDKWMTNPNIVSFNKKIKSELGGKVKIIDLYTHLTKTTWSTSIPYWYQGSNTQNADGVHYDAFTSFRNYNYFISEIDRQAS